MKIRRISLICFAIIIILVTGCITAMAIDVTTKKQQAENIFNELKTDGYSNIEKIWIEDNSMCSTVLSAKNDSLCANDIRNIRAIRNKARALALDNNGELSGITSVNHIIKNSNDEILYDVTIDDFYTIPEEFTDSINLNTRAVTFSEKETIIALASAFGENSLPLRVVEISESSLGGYFLDIVVDNESGQEIDINSINGYVQQVLTIIDNLNVNGHKITEYNISVFSQDTNAEPIYFMSADVIFRDFLWWQSPSLGNETWTGSTPKLTDE